MSVRAFNRLTLHRKTTAVCEFAGFYGCVTEVIILLGYGAMSSVWVIPDTSRPLNTLSRKARGQSPSDKVPYSGRMKASNFVCSNHCKNPQLNNLFSSIYFLSFKAVHYRCILVTTTLYRVKYCVPNVKSGQIYFTSKSKRQIYFYSITYYTYTHLNI